AQGPDAQLWTGGGGQRRQLRRRRVADRPQRGARRGGRRREGELLHPVVVAVGDREGPVAVDAHRAGMDELPFAGPALAERQQPLAVGPEALHPVVAAIGDPQVAVAVERDLGRRVELAELGAAPAELRLLLAARAVDGNAPRRPTA